MEVLRRLRLKQNKKKGKKGKGMGVVYEEHRTHTRARNRLQHVGGR